MYAALDFTFAISDLRPHFGAWVLGVKLGQFAQEFAGALVARVGCGDGDFDDLVAALVGEVIQDAVFAQREALGTVGSRTAPAAAGAEPAGQEARAGGDGREQEALPVLPDQIGRAHVRTPVP